jgi:hypothetical protein
MRSYGLGAASQCLPMKRLREPRIAFGDGRYPTTRRNKRQDGLFASDLYYYFCPYAERRRTLRFTRQSTPYMGAIDFIATSNKSLADDLSQPEVTEIAAISLLGCQAF